MQSNNQRLLSKQWPLSAADVFEAPIRENMKPVNSTAIVLRIDPQNQSARVCEPQRPAIAIRESFCTVCETLVCLELDISLAAMRARTRSTAEVALARQIAMYLAHTSLSVMMTEIGLYFGRDRTTVAHACAVVEDRRDELAFDTTIFQLEAAIEPAIDELLADMADGNFVEVRDEEEAAR